MLICSYAIYYLILEMIALTSVAQLVEMSHAPKGGGFNPQLGHVCEAVDQCFSLPLSPCLPHKSIKKNGGDKLSSVQRRRCVNILSTMPAA